MRELEPAPVVHSKFRSEGPRVGSERSDYTQPESHVRDGLVERNVQDQIAVVDKPFNILVRPAFGLQKIRAKREGMLDPYDPHEIIRKPEADHATPVKREAGIIQVNRPGYQPAHVDREIRAVGRNDSCDCHQKKGDNALDSQPLRPCGF